MSTTGELADAVVRARYERGKTIEEALTEPPTPVEEALFGIDAPTMVVRRTWTQRLPDLSAQTFVPGLEPSLTDRARFVAATPNPLRELAAALVEMADEMDAHLVHPVGLAVVTWHDRADFYRLGTPHVAHVRVSALGVSTEWIRRALAVGDAATSETDAESR